jgi:hypothetical protein
MHFGTCSWQSIFIINSIYYRFQRDILELLATLADDEEAVEVAVEPELRVPPEATKPPAARYPPV